VHTATAVLACRYAQQQWGRLRSFFWTATKLFAPLWSEVSSIGNESLSGITVSIASLVFDSLHFPTCCIRGVWCFGPCLDCTGGSKKKGERSSRVENKTMPKAAVLESTYIWRIWHMYGIQIWRPLPFTLNSGTLRLSPTDKYYRYVSKQAAVGMQCTVHIRSLQMPYVLQLLIPTLQEYYHTESDLNNPLKADHSQARGTCRDDYTEYTKYSHA